MDLSYWPCEASTALQRGIRACRDSGEGCLRAGAVSSISVPNVESNIVEPGRGRAASTCGGSSRTCSFGRNSSRRRRSPESGSLGEAKRYVLCLAGRSHGDHGHRLPYLTCSVAGRNAANGSLASRDSLP